MECVLCVCVCVEEIQNCCLSSTPVFFLTNKVRDLIAYLLGGLSLVAFRKPLNVDFSSSVIMLFLSLNLILSDIFS